MTDVVEKIAIGLVAACVVASLARMARRAQPDSRGWRRVKPGSMHWLGVTLGAGLFFLMAYVWTFVGSTRADAEAQMRILFWLMLAFGAGTIVSAVSIEAMIRAHLRWRGRTIAFVGTDGDVRLGIDRVLGIKHGMLGYTVEFENGACVRIDPYATGAAQLLDLINDELALRQQATGA